MCSEAITCPLSALRDEAMTRGEKVQGWGDGRVSNEKKSS